MGLVEMLHLTNPKKFAHLSCDILVRSNSIKSPHQHGYFQKNYITLIFHFIQRSM